MLRKIRLYFLMKLYRILVVKVYTVDRTVFRTYRKFNNFCELSFDTNFGTFTFKFKLARSVKRSGGFKPTSCRINSYLVELDIPDCQNFNNESLKDKLIIAIMLHSEEPDYEALARTLLDLYIDHFPKK